MRPCCDMALRNSNSVPLGRKGVKIMPTVFWTGKLSLSMKLMVNISNALAWISGNARDTAAMKQRMKLGYEGACTEHVTRYDDLGLEHYTKIARELLKRVDLRGKEVLDVGCGTGILSFLALEQGAVKVFGGVHAGPVSNKGNRTGLQRESGRFPAARCRVPAFRRQQF